MLGFVAENRDGSSSPTRWGYDLAQTGPESPEEKALFFQQIMTAPSLRDVVWFFSTTDEIPSGELAEVIVRERSRRPGFDNVNPATAERRVSTLVQWRQYILNLDQTEEENDVQQR